VKEIRPECLEVVKAWLDEDNRLIYFGDKPVGEVCVPVVAATEFNSSRVWLILNNGILHVTEPVTWSLYSFQGMLTRMTQLAEDQEPMARTQWDHLLKDDNDSG